MLYCIILNLQVCEQHPWHLHGHKFWVVGMGKGTWNGSNSQLAMLNPNNAVYRDTVTVLPDAVKPFNRQSKQGGCGWTVIRFVADNPGVWPFHCHVTWHFVMGMHTVFISSVNEIPSPPSDVPICGDINPQTYTKHHKLVKKSENDDMKDRNKTYLTLLAVGWGLFTLVLILCIYMIVNKKGESSEPYSVEMNTIQNPGSKA